jgi:hypothetical protein
MSIPRSQWMTFTTQPALKDAGQKFERLDGEPFDSTPFDNTFCLVKWSDGKITEEVLWVIERTTSVDDLGSDDGPPYPDSVLCYRNSQGGPAHIPSGVSIILLGK